MENPIVCYNEQLIKMLEVMRAKGMTPERLEKLLKSRLFDNLCDPKANLDAREAVRMALELESVPRIFHYTINYDRPRLFEELVIAGRYDKVHPRITPESFPIEGKGVVEFEARYFCFDYDIPWEELKEEVRCAGGAAGPWKYAKIEHLLMHGIRYPEEQRKQAIVVSGSQIDTGGYHDRFGYPFIHDYSSVRRELDLHFPRYTSFFHSGLQRGLSFLAVREIQRP